MRINQQPKRAVFQLSDYMMISKKIYIYGSNPKQYILFSL